MRNLRKGKKNIYAILTIMLIVSVVIEVMLAHPHYDMIWNEVAGFDIIIGFAGAWLLIIVAKLVMAKLLQRKEDYYDEDGAKIQEQLCDNEENAACKSSNGGGQDV